MAHSKSHKRSRSPKSKSRSRSRSRSRSPKSGGKLKFFDLIMKKPFYTSEYAIVVTKNGKHRAVTTNPTKTKDGKTFKTGKFIKE